MIPTPYKIGAAVLAVLAFGGACGWGGYAYRDARCVATINGMKADAAKAAQDAEADAREIERLQGEVTASAGELHQLREAARNRTAEVVVREVIRYVTSDPDAGSCELPDNWLRIKNASARGESPGVPEAGRGADGAAAGSVAGDQ